MISKHVSYKEGTFSATATRLGFDNIPDDEQLANMKLVAEKIFEPLREWVGGAVKVKSFFRGLKLNTAIGGARKSQHMKGKAIDIDDNYGVVANSDMYHYIKNNLDFDQLIWEFGDDDNPNWLHVSYVSPEKNRNRCLKAYKEQGKSKYMVI